MAHLFLSIVVAAILPLMASACGGENLPTAPATQSAPTPAPTPSAASYRVSGRVLGPGQMPIAGARVEVHLPDRVRTSQTDSSGFFGIEGVPGPASADVYVSAEGHWTVHQFLNLVADSSLTFELARTPLASGTYRLTISASGDCHHQLPETARTRTYSAYLQYDYDPWYLGMFMNVTLGGAQFRVDSLGTHGGFYGVPSGEGVSFVLVGDYNRVALTSPYVSVVDQLTATTALVIAGYANLSGTLDGVLHIVRTVAGQDPDYRNPIAVCRSNAHQFELSR